WTISLGSFTGSGSWCLDAELLEANDNHKNVKGVCAQVSCDEGTVKVKYSGSKDFHPCPENTDIPVTLNGVEGGKIKCPKYGEVCTIAANGSSLVIPSVLQNDKEEKQDAQGEETVVSPAVSPVASTPEEPRAEASFTEEPRAEAPPKEGPRAEASSPSKTSEASGVQEASQQPPQENKTEQITTVGESATTQQVPENTSQESLEKAAASNSHAVGEAKGEGTMRGSGLLPSLLLLLGLWGFAAL
ncbi:surface protease GP63, putative, partial [Trypanosoma cruzi marinkellei]